MKGGVLSILFNICVFFRLVEIFGGVFIYFWLKLIFDKNYYDCSVLGY